MYIQANLTLYQDEVASNPSLFTINYQLNGINAPLTFESSIALKTVKTVDTICLILSVFIIFEFYSGSYFGKMIGL